MARRRSPVSGDLRHCHASFVAWDACEVRSLALLVSVEDGEARDVVPPEN